MKRLLLTVSLMLPAGLIAMQAEKPDDYTRVLTAIRAGKLQTFVDKLPHIAESGDIAERIQPQVLAKAAELEKQGTAASIQEINETVALLDFLDYYNDYFAGRRIASRLDDLKRTIQDLPFVRKRQADRKATEEKAQAEAQEKREALTQKMVAAYKKGGEIAVRDALNEAFQLQGSIQVGTGGDDFAQAVKADTLRTATDLLARPEQATPEDITRTLALLSVIHSAGHLEGLELQKNLSNLRSTKRTESVIAQGEDLAAHPETTTIESLEAVIPTLEFYRRNEDDAQKRKRIDSVIAKLKMMLEVKTAARHKQLFGK